jgi:cytochrome bd-type quinol oxidase subunit 1
LRLDLARWQFAFTSINHFLFIPIPIGLAFRTALLQTAWHRTDRDEYLRLTRFFGTLLVINVAIGVVTGIVQEFEFVLVVSLTTGAVIMLVPPQPLPSQSGPLRVASDVLPPALARWIKGGRHGR